MNDSEKIYIIDSCSLIELNHNNPMDVYPTVWKNMESLIKSGRLWAPVEVLNEINVGDDALNNWLSEFSSIFKKPNSYQFKQVSEILSKYPALVNVEARYSADPWLIALVKDFQRQERLISQEYFVVTQETLRGNKVKLPYVCQELNINCISIIDMFRMENWKI